MARTGNLEWEEVARTGNLGWEGVARTGTCGEEVAQAGAHRPGTP